MWQVHHWPSSAWLPMCLVSSTCRCRWLQRRYILRFKKKQINYYINLTLFFSQISMIDNTHIYNYYNYDTALQPSWERVRSRFRLITSLTSISGPPGAAPSEAAGHVKRAGFAGMDWIGKGEKKRVSTWIAFLNSTSNALLQKHYLGTPGRERNLHLISMPSNIYIYIYEINK